MVKHAGRLELTWTDKDKALLSVGDGKYDYTFVDPADYRVSEVRLLHEVDRFDAEASMGALEGLPEPTTDNLLITGDAMHVLDALRSIPEHADKYLGKTKLCYIDPPFNTGRAFDNYEDNIEHSIWLTMLRDRLQQIKPLLDDDGSVWVHLDDVEVHRCRMVLDEIMGIENFVAQVVWQKADSTRNDSKGISEDHDTLLVYRASRQWSPLKLPRTAASNARFSSPDGDPTPWFDADPTAPGARTHQGMVYAVQHPITGALHYPAQGRHWWTEQNQILGFMNEYAIYELRDINDAACRARLCGIDEKIVRADVRAVMLAVPVEISAESARRRLSEGPLPVIVLRSGGEGGIGRKSYIPHAGLVPSTWWSNTEVGHNREAKAEIKALFPESNVFATPKPERLLQRIIQISTKPGDIVLDCFGGSGTTAAVAHKMGRRWVTAELSIENIETYIKPRLLKVINGQDKNGASSITSRLAATGSELPGGISPEEAQDFNRLLNKVKKELDGLDGETLKLLSNATKTRDEKVVNWVGGGGFTHLQVGRSMFEEADGRVFLADWAVNGALSEAMCAQLRVRHRPDGIFAGKDGTIRLVIVDGMVTSSTVEAILDQLPEGEIVHVWATQIDMDAAEQLRKTCPGSKLLTIPGAVLDTYRRKAATRSPFTSVKSNGEPQ